MKEDFEKFFKFLKTTDLSDQERDTYLLGLEKGVIKTSDIMERLGVAQSRAGSILTKMTNNGYFIVSVADGSGGTGGTGKGYEYVTVSPTQKFAPLKEIVPAMDRIDEGLEQLLEGYLEEGFWEIPKQEIALKMATEALANAQESVFICSNDCDWIEDSDIADCLRDCTDRRIPINVLACNPSDEVCKSLSAIGVTIKSIKPILPPSFVIVDQKILFLAFGTGSYSTRYGLLRISKQYLVRRFVDFFLSIDNGDDSNG